MRLASSLRPTASPTEERGAALVLLPIAATLDYYALPHWLQEQALVQFAPQIIAYLACALWASHNAGLIARFGLDTQKFASGLRAGLLIGFGLGCLNSVLILHVFPSFGFDIAFLKNTPHARLPVLLMVPWFICFIAVFVELNFRGFLLGRLLAMGQAVTGPDRPLLLSGLAIAISALVFSFDPFMTQTFRDLHWIAVWDGAVWGACWIATRNLYVPIVAHAVEVIVMYSAVRTALM